MQNKSNANNRDDIKVIITATALTLTLAFWNIFSSGTQPPIKTTNLESATTATQIQQGKILLGGPPPQTTIMVSQSGSPRQQNQQSRPQPVTNTASSK